METSHFFQTLHKEHISLVRSIYYRVEKSDVFFSINMASNLLKYVYESIDKEKKNKKHLFISIIKNWPIIPPFSPIFFLSNEK